MTASDTTVGRAAIEVPVYDPKSGEGLKTPRSVQRQSRRQFLQLAAAVGAGVGLACLDVLSNPFIRRAGAAAYEYWDDCRSYFNESTICVPPNAYYGSDNCDVFYLAHFHKSATTYWNDGQGHDYRADYSHDPSSCSGRNAWIWRGRVASKMCSDGYKARYISYDGSDGWRREFSSFSICRTVAP